MSDIKKRNKGARNRKGSGGFKMAHSAEDVKSIRPQKLNISEIEEPSATSNCVSTVLLMLFLILVFIGGFYFMFDDEQSQSLYKAVKNQKYIIDDCESSEDCKQNDVRSSLKEQTGLMKFNHLYYTKIFNYLNMYDDDTDDGKQIVVKHESYKTGSESNEIYEESDEKDETAEENKKSENSIFSSLSKLYAIIPLFGYYGEEKYVTIDDESKVDCIDEDNSDFISAENCDEENYSADDISLEIDDSKRDLSCEYNSGDEDYIDNNNGLNAVVSQETNDNYDLKRGDDNKNIEQENCMNLNNESKENIDINECEDNDNENYSSEINSVDPKSKTSNMMNNKFKFYKGAKEFSHKKNEDKILFNKRWKTSLENKIKIKRFISDVTKEHLVHRETEGGKDASRSKKNINRKYENKINTNKMKIEDSSIDDNKYRLKSNKQIFSKNSLQGDKSTEKINRKLVTKNVADRNKVDRMIDKNIKANNENSGDNVSDDGMKFNFDITSGKYDAKGNRIDKTIKVNNEFDGDNISDEGMEFDLDITSGKYDAKGNRIDKTIKVNNEFDGDNISDEGMEFDLDITNGKYDPKGNRIDKTIKVNNAFDGDNISDEGTEFGLDIRSGKYDAEGNIIGKTIEVNNEFDGDNISDEGMEFDLDITSGKYDTKANRIEKTIERIDENIKTNDFEIDLDKISKKYDNKMLLNFHRIDEMTEQIYENVQNNIKDHSGENLMVNNAFFSAPNKANEISSGEESNVDNENVINGETEFRSQEDDTNSDSSEKFDQTSGEIHSDVDHKKLPEDVKNVTSFFDVIINITVGVALIIVAYAVLLRKWNNYVAEDSKLEENFDLETEENEKSAIRYDHPSSEEQFQAFSSDDSNDGSNFEGDDDLLPDDGEYYTTPGPSSMHDYTLDDFQEDFSNLDGEHLMSEDQLYSESDESSRGRMTDDTDEGSQDEIFDENDHDGDANEVYSKYNITNNEDFLIKDQLDAADDLFDDGHINEALKNYANILVTNDHSPRAKYGLAKCMDANAEKMRNNKLLSDAIRAYNDVLNMQNIPDALFKLIGWRLIDRIRFKGDYWSAISIHHHLIERFPDDIAFQNQLAVSYLMLNKNEEAAIVLSRVLEKWPDDGFAKVHLGFVLKLKNQYAEAINYLTDGIKSNEPGTQDSRFYFHLGDALYRLHRPSEAMEIYKYGVEHGMFRSVYQRSLYNVDRLTARPWWTLEQTTYHSFFRMLEENWINIRDEALILMRNERNAFLEESESLREIGDWRQLELYSRGKERASCKKVPLTCKLISSFSRAAECLRGQIKFSLMAPKTHVWPHCGPTNCRLRAHLGLIIPTGAAIRVANETRYWQEGKVIIFDDSFEHEVWHNGTTDRLVLIVDVWHPELTELEMKKLFPI